MMLIKMLQRPDGTWDMWSLIGALFALVMLAISISIAYAVWFHDQPPVFFHNSPFPVDQGVYESGEAMLVTVQFTQYTAAPVTVHRRWQCDEIAFQEVAELSGGERGGPQELQFQLTVPDISGECFIDYRFVYNVNPVAPPRVVEAQTQRFTVIGE